MTIITDVPEHLFVLPQVFEPIKNKRKPNNNVPDVESLTVDQRAAYEAIIAYMEGKAPAEVKMLSFEGNAGTGKTYVITQVLKWYVLMMQDEIAITAPTNKAVKVLRQTANFTHSLIRYCTIYKLYGLKEKINETTGKRTFEPEFGEDNEIDSTDALVIDETSMLPDEIFYLIQQSNNKIRERRDNTLTKLGSGSIDDINYLLNKATNDGKRVIEDHLKVIFVGDPLQIPPVNKADSIPYNDRTAEEYFIQRIRLTEIIRQKKGNPIIEFAAVIRDNYKNSFIPYDRKTTLNKEGGVSFIAAADKDVIYRLCEVYFTNPRFADDSDFMKVIAWTNRTVTFMNNKIRTYVHKAILEALQQEALTAEREKALGDIDEDEIIKNVKLPRILIGEKLIADSPITEDLGYKRLSVFNTNDEFEVTSFREKYIDVFKNYTVKVYQCNVRFIDYNTGKSEYRHIDILHEDSIEVYDQLLESLKNSALKATENRGQAWKLYYMMREKFADVNYNYAITAHKSQGSTYDNVIVIVADIDQNKKIQERNRIKYVAFTRAKQHLFIVE